MARVFITSVPRNSLASLRHRWTRVRDHAPGTLTWVETDESVAALTFDDGPHPDFTPRLLDLLKEHHARATFFMVGEAAAARPDLVRRVAAEGHEIGNHTWDHPLFPSLPGRERRRQIRACAEALSPFGGRLFRAPYGAQSLASRLDAFLLGYGVNGVIGWSVEAKDWRDPDPAAMAERLISGIRPGSIILLHDAIYRSRQKVPLYDRDPMLSALRTMLERLNGKFRFVTIPDLLRCGTPRRESVKAAPSA